METVIRAADGAAKKAAPPPPPSAETATGWKAPAAMVLVQLFNTGMVLLSKVAIGGGMFVFALLAYRSIFGAAIILPLALLRERGKWREMDWPAAGWIFLNAFIGYAVPMSLYYYGLQDTTASYAVIFLNIIPLTTFILSLVFRMEALRVRSKAGSLKIAGVMLSVGGTMLISIYKGKTLHLWNSVLHYHKEQQMEVATHQLRGTMLLVGSSFAFACWYLIQSKVLNVYPYKYWSSMATCLVGGFQTALVGVILRRDKSAWKIGWDINLATIVYSGALATAGKYSLNSWAVVKKGPAYPPMFSPLSVVFTVVFGSIFIGDDITVGSLIGTAMVIAGIYVFLWAKAKELPEK
ncbi:WAT1-related protein At5g64700-like [Phragmites australis]|uniref:WAT1-related protein At5g64700-like n=1 Tax=Phragmites australis TaxID=29695 RepID=UPI002D776C68|nr:WAT1-related protein At5g64700-like [Phragmites australis]